MKKLIFYTVLLLLGLGFWSSLKSDESDKYKYELRGKELVKGFTYKQNADYFYIRYLISQGVYKGPKSVYGHYKVNKPKWIREHRVPYPTILDTFKPPTRRQITKYVTNDCLYKSLTNEDKLEVIDDTVNYWKITKVMHKKWKKRMYYTSPTCGAVMMIDEKGKASNASMMGLGIGWVQHNLKSGKRFSTQIITLPMCQF